MDTRISGFYRWTPEERLDLVAKHSNLTQEEKDLIIGEQIFSAEQADRMAENVIGTFPVPLGVAVNFKVNGKGVLIPMATEEPSVIAAASNAAKQCKDGFFTSYSGSIMRAQVQAVRVKDPYGAQARIYENKEKIIELCNKADPTLVSLGGGLKDIEVHVIQGLENMVVTHLLADTKDAMGANTVNTMAERIAPFIEELTGGKVILRILSNLADKRIIRARGVFENPFPDSLEMLEHFIYAYELADIDPYRAATHNKGIMNGITAVVMATGNDTRAVEAGAHAYAAVTGRYRSLTRWEIGENDSLVGTIELPMPVGLVGGATASHPTAKAAIKILDVKTAEELAGIIAAAGLAQNFAALRVLASEGVQKGHMKLHARNLAVMAGAKDEQVGQVLHIAEQQDSFTYDKIRQIVLALQENEEK